MKNILIQLAILLAVILTIVGLNFALQDEFAFGSYNGTIVAFKENVNQGAIKTAVDNALKDTHKGYKIKKIAASEEAKAAATKMNQKLDIEYQIQTRKMLSEEDRKKLNEEIGKLDLKAQVFDTLIYSKNSAFSFNYDIYLINLAVIVLVTIVFAIITKKISSKL